MRGELDSGVGAAGLLSKAGGEKCSETRIYREIDWMGVIRTESFCHRLGLEIDLEDG